MLRGPFQPVVNKELKPPLTLPGLPSRGWCPPQRLSVLLVWVLPVPSCCSRLHQSASSFPWPSLCFL